MVQAVLECIQLRGDDSVFNYAKQCSSVFNYVVVVALCASVQVVHIPDESAGLIKECCCVFG